MAAISSIRAHAPATICWHSTKQHFKMAVMLVAPNVAHALLRAASRLVSTLGFLTCAIALAQPTREQIEFFERRIRPVLAERCYECHGPKASPPMSGLRLDTRIGLLKGGERGPAIVPGDPENS